MKNITVAISDTAYHEARVWAAHQDISISGITQFLLEHMWRIPKWIIADLHNNVPLPPSRKNTVLSAKSPDAAIHSNPQPAESKEVPSEKPLPIADFEL